MMKLKSAKHHWWPECVSAHWVAEDGKTGWLKPDGTVLRVPPKNLGAIGNAHHIKFSSKHGETSLFDSCFESEYDSADNSFPEVISWLRSLDREYLPDLDLSARFIPHEYTSDRLIALTECAVSLAVRGPRNREASVGIAERLRGPIPSPEREIRSIILEFKRVCLWRRILPQRLWSNQPSCRSQNLCANYTGYQRLRHLSKAF